MAVKKQMEANGWPFAEAVTKGIMCEPGKGGIDFKKFFAAMNDAGYDGWAVVEQDLYPVPSFDLPLEIAERTRNYLRSVGV
jgi:inosose dehydratase